MKNNACRKIAAFSLPELLVVVAVICVLAVVAVSGPLDQAKTKANRISCVGRHKQIGTAFRIFDSDNGGKNPLEVQTNDFGVTNPRMTRTYPPGWKYSGPTNAYILKSGAIGSQVDSTNATAWQVAQAMWHQLQSPKLLLCPSDRERVTCSRTTDFNALAGAPGIMTTASFGHPANQNLALSYAFGVIGDESRPLGVMVMDRNVNNVGLAGAGLASNVALTRTRAVMTHKPGPTQAVYVKGTRMHGLEGNLAFADGSVQQATAEVLRQSFENAAKVYNTITNQNEMLFP